MRTKSLIFFFILYFLSSECSFSNDSGIAAVGGTWMVMKGEHPSIQMERETIKIDVYKDYYDVEATFIFKNIGDSCSVFMGFPESGGGDVPCHSDSSCFISFSTSVNGKNVDAVRVMAKTNEFEYLAYWIKYVHFENKETKKIIVNYRSPIGGRADAYRYFFTYTFSGGNWFGQVLESKMNIYFHMPVEISKDANNNIKKEKDHYSYNRTNWEAQENFFVAYKIVG